MLVMCRGTLIASVSITSMRNSSVTSGKQSLVHPTTWADYNVEYFFLFEMLDYKKQKNACREKSHSEENGEGRNE